MKLIEIFFLICLVESGFDTEAVGRHGELGPAQITAIMVEDFNRIAGENLLHEEVKSYTVSFMVFETVLRHYEREIYERSPAKYSDIEAIARFWNGGPNWRRATGNKLSNLNNYWEKIKKELTNVKKYSSIAL